MFVVMDGTAKFNYRTKSWDESIVEHHTFSGGVQQVEFQPGNGTRYRVLFILVPNLEHALSNGQTYRASSHWIVALPDYNSSMEVQGEEQGFLHWDYVQEKLSDRRKTPWSPADMVPVTELIGRIIGREVISSQEQEQRDEALTAEQADSASP